MNQRIVFRVLGFIIVTVGTGLIPPTVMAWTRHSPVLASLAVSASIAIVLGILTLLLTRGKKIELHARDGFAIVTFGWLAAALFGSLPYYLSGVCSTFPDAIFEAMSGFTTTGSTILTNIESVPHAMLLWRSTTQWMGGMGIVVLSVAVLPLLGVGGMQLFKAEVPGPITDRLTPRIQNVAKSLWAVYLGLTIMETALLMLGGMTLFDAVNHSFCTVSTGGFSTRNASIGAFDSLFIESVVLAFMFLAGVNFSLHLWPLLQKIPGYLKDEEFRLYAVFSAIASLIIGLGLLVGSHHDLLTATRRAVFQTISILTTTGFGTANYLTWGFGAQVLLFCLMFLGACAGSTSGGMKLMRIIVLFKHGVIMAIQEIHPRAIYKVRYNGAVVSRDVMMRILGFFLLYIAIFFLTSIFLGLMGIDVLSAMGASVATLGNIGPGFGSVGPVENFAHLPGAAKILLSINMLLGRLELYTVIVVLMPPFWRRT